MMEKSKHLIMMLLILLLSYPMYGQDATTSSMNGNIVDSKGSPLTGATIVATHVPSGSLYGATANTQGFFSIQGMRPGGPYKVEVSFVGFSKITFTDINLFLGSTYTLNTPLKESSTELGEVVVVGSKPSAFNTTKTGASTNVSKESMAMVPSLNRSLNDYTKLSPYSSGNGSYVGREAYMTNVTVDGANFNNNFGLSSGNMPSVSGEPISMEAIEEIQVAVAPYDVRQSNFTGAGVNAITKSGTNQFKGTVYGFYRNQDMNGKYVRNTKLSVAQSAKQAIGFNFGGPIIKDKLFFFLSADKENTLTPGNTLLAMQSGRDAADPNVNARVYADSLKAFSQTLKTVYNYETGRYEDWGGDNENNNKVLLKLNWNISKNHKFSIRYNYSESKAIFRPSASGDASPTITPSNGRHTKLGGMSFENSQYGNSNTLHSITGEMNSRFGQLSNKMLVAYTKYHQPRTSTSSVFPFIDIMAGNPATGDVTMSAGYELFSYKNNVDNNTLIATDDITYVLDKHTFTFGLSYEQQYFANSYLRQGSGYYRFKSLKAFQNFAAGMGTSGTYNDNWDPTNFAYTYPINGITDPVAELRFGQFASYLQDEFEVIRNLKVTAGVRIDLPIYLAGAVDNPALKSYSFNNGETVDLSTWPDAKILWSPRIGFNYDVFGNKTLKVRGGTGIFTGRIPFVWFTNQPSNSGMLQYQLVINQSTNAAAKAMLSRLPSNLLPNAADLLKDPTLTDIFPTQNPVGGRIASIAKDFKLPQVWRTSLGFDVKLPLNMSLTLEGIYTKDINSIWFKNINLADAASSTVEGSQSRPYWSNASKYTTSPYQNVVEMLNTDKGEGYTISASLDLPKYKGFSGMLSYSKSWGVEVTGKSGSDPFSAWQYRVIQNNPNVPEMGYTLNNTPLRIVGQANYTIDYLKICSSTITFFFTGYHGDAYSYIYSGDVNADGTTSNDLMYIPKDASEFIWGTVKTVAGVQTITLSPADADAYFKFAAQDPYLSKHAGEYAYRNGAYNPWYKRLDMRFMQDFKVKAGKSTNTLELSVDIINFANLLNHSLGLNRSYVTNSPIIYNGKDNITGKPIVSMRKIGADYVGYSFQDPTSVAGTYSIQIGLRYIFN